MLAKRTIGRSAVELTELSLGTASIGGLTRPVTDTEADDVMAAAWGAGIRYFDTAPYYGLGLAEQRLGRFLAGKGAEPFVLSTKVGRVLEPLDAGETPTSAFQGALPYKVVFDYSYDGVMRSFEQSCERLSGLVPQILYVHDIGRRRHGNDHQRHLESFLGGGLEALQALKTRGAIKAFGLGVNEAQVCLEVLEHADIDVILLANRYTLIDREAENALLTRCADLGVSLVIGGVFNSGLLAAPDPRRATFDYRPPSDATARLVEELASLCRKYGTDIVTAALNFPLRSPVVASVLVGTARTSSLDECLQKHAGDTPEALWTEIEQLLRETDARTPRGAA